MFGVYTKEQLTNSQYHAADGISKSKLDLVEVNPYNLHVSSQTEQTRAMELGSAFHCATLEPSEFDSSYIILDGVVSRASAEYKKHAKLHSSELVLTETEGCNIVGMRDAMHRNESFMAVFGMDGNAEFSIFTKDPVTGLMCKCRFDFVTNCGKAIDLKKTQSVNVEDFSRSVFRYRYYVQEAFYRDVFKWHFGDDLQSFQFAACEERFPHGNRMFTLDEDAVEYGRKCYRMNLDQYARCLESGDFGSASFGDAFISLPAWVFGDGDDITFGDEE